MYVTVQFHCHPEKFHLSPSNKVSISELLTLLVAVLGASSYLLTPLLCWCYCGFTATLCTVVVLLFKIQGYFIMWLPISERIQYKVACICFNAINGSGPAYLSELLHVYTHTLHSSSDTCILKIQQYKCWTQIFCTFSCFGPHMWNSLPQDLRHCSTHSSFKAKLKTILFSQYFNPN